MGFVNQIKHTSKVYLTDISNVQIYKNSKHDFTVLHGGQESEIITQRSGQFDHERADLFSSTSQIWKSRTCLPERLLSRVKDRPANFFEKYL